MTRPAATSPGPAAAGTVILASAGTGKTFALTNRLMALLAAGEDPSAVIAATFTRKAAGEILGRLLLRLASAVVVPEGLQELREHVDPRLTAERCAAVLAGLLAELDRLPILTIDALLIRLAGLFGLEAGLPPRWRIADEDEDDSLREEALDEALRGEPGAVRALLQGLLRERPAARSVRAVAWEAASASLEAVLATRGHPEAWTRLGPDPADRLPGPALEAARRALAGAEASLPVTAKGEPDGRFVKAFRAAVQRATDGDWRGLVADGLGAAFLSEERCYYRIELPPRLAGALAPLVGHARHEVLRELAARTAACRALAERFAEAYQRAKLRAGALRFDDIPRLLLEREDAGELGPLYYRLDARVRHVLLDEFQDTSVEQFRLLQPLLEELLAGEGAVESAAGRSVLCVGDVKQSLFAWRNAEPTLLPHLLVRWPQMQRQPLTANFRSSPVVLETVNRVFAPLAENPFLAGSTAAEEFAGGFQAHTAGGPNAGLTGAVRLLVAEPRGGEGDGGRADDSLKAQRAGCSALAIERAIALHREFPGWSIAIVLRKNAAMGRLVHGLRAAGVEAVKEGGNPLIDTPAIAAVVSLLRAMVHPVDTAALYHVATGPLGEAAGLREPLDAAAAAGRLSALRGELARSGLARFLLALRGRMDRVLDRRSAERFDQLLDRALVFEATAGPDAAGFAEHLVSHGVEEPGSARVRVTTIHKAKGLEFDAVIAAELVEPWTHRPGPVLMARAADAGPLDPPALVSVHPDEVVRSISPEAAAAVERAKAAEVHEELCGLYVALTRAKRVMECLVPPAAAPATLAKWPAAPTAAQVLHAALAPERPAEAGAVLWAAPGSDASLFAAAPAGARAEAAGGGAGRAGGVAADGPPCRLRDGAELPAWRLRGVSPSGLEGGATVRLGEVLRPSARSRPGLALGTLLHAWFERVEWADRPVPDDAELLAAAERIGIGREAAAPALEAFRAALGRPGLRARLSRSAYPSEGVEVRVRREWPLAVRMNLPDGPALLSGFVDRVVIVERAGRAVSADVLDFKTDAVDPGEDARAFAARVEHYRPQVAAYRGALGRRLGLPAASIAAALLFTRSGTVVDLPADTDGGG